MQKLKSKWVCVDCKKRTEREVRKSLVTPNTEASPGSATDPSNQHNNGQDEDKILKSIQELKLEVTNEIRELKLSMTFYADKYEEQKLKNEAFAEEIKQLKKLNEETQQEIKRLKSENTIKDQQARSNNVVIVGISNSIEDQKSNSQIKRKVDMVISHIDPEIKPTDYQIHIVTKAKENSPLLISFHKPQCKESLLARRKEKGKIQGSDCGLVKSNPIYVNEDLTRETRELFREARKLRRDVGYKFVWVKAGNVFARRNEDSDVIKIKFIKDIEKLLSERISG